MRSYVRNFHAQSGFGADAAPRVIVVPCVNCGPSFLDDVLEVTSIIGLFTAVGLGIGLGWYSVKKLVGEG